MSQTTRKKSKIIDIVLVSLALACIAATVLFALDKSIVFDADVRIDALAKDVIERLFLAAFLVVFCLSTTFKSLMKFNVKPAKGLFALVPCMLVALANFPFSAIIGGGAIVQKNQYVWLFCLQCALIGVVEELVFRLVAWVLVTDKTKGKPLVLQVIVNSAVFALWHLVNLLFGQGIGTTLLQVGYSFLIGAMLTTLYIVTSNIWWCVAVHAMFDFGGKLVATLGSGNVWDVPFWIATAVGGVICAVWVLYVLLVQCKNAPWVAVNCGIAVENIKSVDVDVVQNPSGAVDIDIAANDNER